MAQNELVELAKKLTEQRQQKAQKIRHYIDTALADYAQSKRVLTDKNQLICNELNFITIMTEYLTNENTPKELKKELEGHIQNSTNIIHKIIYNKD